jgi:hypothetical protein
MVERIPIGPIRLFGKIKNDPRDWATCYSFTEGDCGFDCPDLKCGLCRIVREDVECHGFRIVQHP